MPLRASFFALLLVASAAAGLDPRTALTQYGHTAWRVREGHFAGSPSAVAQTTDGFLWIGTDAGLIRFDGVRFLPWEPPPGSHLPGARIISLLGSRDGSLWIGTNNGLARWHDSRLVVYAEAGRFGALVEDRRGTIWAGHTRSLEEVPPLCRFEGGRFECFRFAEELGLGYVGSLHVDQRGDLWIGGVTGACRWRPESPESPECHEIASLVPLTGKSAIFGLAQDAGGTLWAGAGALGVWRLGPGGWDRYPRLPAPAIDTGTIFSDRGGALWIGTSDHGFIRLVQGRTEAFTRADGLSSGEVNFIFEDREGSVWVATSSGLDRFRNVKVATLTPREGLLGGNVVSVAASREGGVWIAERRALLRAGRAETAGISVVATGPGLPGSSLGSLFEDSHGRLWLGVDNGLAWWENGHFSRVAMPDGSSVGVVFSMVEDGEGNLWVATASAQPSHVLLRLRDGQVLETLPGETFGGKHFGTIAASPEGGVWIGFENGELGLYRHGSFKLQAGAENLGARSLHCLLPDARGLWMGTTRGLFLLRNGRRPSQLDTRKGLPCDDVQELVLGKDGSLWLKTPCGLVQILPGELDAWAAQPAGPARVRTLDVFDGFQAGLPPYTPRSARSLDGRLWFPIEGGGLQVLDPASLPGNPTPPPVRILRAVADRVTYEPGLRLRLPPLTRDVEIDYAALSLAVPEKVRFRYRLEGGGGGWQDAGTRREVFYTNLSPGQYRFHVMACNNDGVWNREGATLDFAILPAFYQTRWFLALCAAAVAGLAWSVYRWRVRQVRASLDRRFEERLAERMRIAQDLHDTLLQGFLSASMQLYVACEELPPGEPARGRFEQVQQLMRQVIDEGRAALRGLRSPEPDADDLEASLARVPGELGIQGTANFRVVVEGRFRPLLPAVRDEIYRIAREALVNAFRHADAAAIEVEIEYTARQLRVVIRDDGAGIDDAVVRAGREDHWGLSGMRERAERIGARLQVWSRAGSGTEIELAVPSKVAFAPERRQSSG